MKKSEEERAKLTANFLNGVGITMVAAGAIAPLVAFSDGVRARRTSWFSPL